MKENIVIRPGDPNYDEIADGSGEELEARPIDERIAELEKMKAGFKEAIAWLDEKMPGESSKPGSSRLYSKLKNQNQ